MNQIPEGESCRECVYKRSLIDFPYRRQWSCLVYGKKIKQVTVYPYNLERLPQCIEERPRIVLDIKRIMPSGEMTGE